MTKLNLREAEERARQAASLGRPGAVVARDFLALAALYREAVEALEECATWSQELQDRLELHGNAIAYWRGVVAVAKAALAKAREAGIGPEGGN